MALVGVLAVMWAVSLGCGLAVERVLGLRLENGLVLVLGLCASLVLIMPGYALGAGDALAIVLLAVVALAGLAFARDGLPARLNPGWAGVAGVATYVIYMLPVIATGHWTWSGYDFVNDTSFEMLLADHVRGFGTVLGNVPQSTEREFLSAYLGNGYPLGAQALLGTFGGLTDTPAAVLYQGFISGLAAFGAISLTRLVSGLLSARRAAFVAVTAMAANLTYQYALQGGIKEIGLLATLCVTAALAREAVQAPERPFASAASVAVGAAGALAVYNAVAAPFLGAMMLFLGLGAIITRRRSVSSRWIAPVIAGGLLTALLSIPALSILKTFFNVAQTGQGAAGVGASQFGQLLRPLPLSQLSGVWLSGEYRTPVLPQPAATLTVIATVLILVGAVPAVLWALRRRELGPLVILGMVGLVLAVVYPRASPYARGKLLALGSPAVVLVVLAALASAPSRFSRPALLLALALAGGVFASDLLSYTHDRVAPTSRIEAITQVGDRLRGQGPVLWNEFEEYAKYFARAARLDVPFEALTPQQVQLRNPSDFYGHYFDLDEELLPFVEQYPLIVTRRSPSASRPPANYALAYQNRYYLAWRRTARPQVLGHLPEQQTYSATAPVGCGQLSALVKAAPSVSRLEVAVAPELSWFEPLYSEDRSFGWGIDPSQQGAVVTNTPGHATGTVDVRSPGSYRVWVQGDFPAPVHIEVDGHEVGHASGSDTPGQWSPVATVTLAAGEHVLRALRPGGRRHFGPGEFAHGLLGAVALQAHGSERLTTLPVSRWRSLCGTEADWVELVR